MFFLIFNKVTEISAIYNLHISLKISWIGVGVWVDWDGDEGELGWEYGLGLGCGWIGVGWG